MKDRTARPLVLGAGGRLGLELQANMADAYPAASYATRAELDITDRWRLESELERLEPTVIINTGSMTHVDGCEDLPEASDEVNHIGAGNVARAATHLGARLIHISTDLVFDGKLDRPYTEEDAAAPLSVYGRTKHLGEIAVQRECPDAVILRAAWFFGAGASKFPENFLGMIAGKKALSLVDDRFGSPTYIPDIAEGIVRLMSVPFRGILHFTNTSSKMSRYEFIKSAAEKMGLDTSTLSGISSRDWKGDKAPRPMNSSLDASRFIALIGWKPQSTDAALDAFIREGSMTDEMS